MLSRAKNSGDFLRRRRFRFRAKPLQGLELGAKKTPAWKAYRAGDAMLRTAYPRLRTWGLRDTGRLGVVRVVLRNLDVLGQAQLFEQKNAQIVGVEFVPGQSVPCGDGMRVMVVVPSLAPGQQGDPPAVS